MLSFTQVRRSRASARSRGVGWALLTTVLIALNLRTPVTSLGPVLPDARHEMGLSATVASVATSTPVLCFGLLALASPWLARRLGLDRSMALAVLGLFAGLLLRPAGGELTLLAGTVLCCAGIAVANVLLPAVVKARAPESIGLVTGAYTAALAGGSALAAAVTAPLAQAFGLRNALWVWAAPALVALVVWAPHLWGRSSALVPPPTTGAGAMSPVPPEAEISVWRSPVGWALALLFGTQSTMAYVTMGWLPTLLQSRGIPANAAGLLLAVSILVSVPVSAVVPTLAARRYSQVGLIVGLTVCAALGLGGLTFAPTGAAWAFAVVLGVGNGVFPLTLTLFSLRARSARETQELSAMGQGVGYLLAASGPFLFGVIGASTGGWTLPVVGMMLVMAVQVGAGVVAGRPRSRSTSGGGRGPGESGQGRTQAAAPCPRRTLP